MENEVNISSLKLEEDEIFFEEDEVPKIDKKKEISALKIVEEERRKILRKQLKQQLLAKKGLRGGDLSSIKDPQDILKHKGLSSEQKSKINNVITKIQNDPTNSEHVDNLIKHVPKSNTNASHLIKKNVDDYKKMQKLLSKFKQNPDDEAMTNEIKTLMEQKGITQEFMQKLYSDKDLLEKLSK